MIKDRLKQSPFYHYVTEWTLPAVVEALGLKWKEVERDLSEILASYGEPPIYQNRLNRIRRDGKATQMELKALAEWSGGLLDSYKG